MIIYLVGMSCVGKTTIGKLLAEYIEYEFYDLDNEVEKYYKKSIENLQNDSYSTNKYREKASVVLDKILMNNDNIVVAGTPSGLKFDYLQVYKKNKKRKAITSIHIYDTFQNVLDRITFYDGESNLVKEVLHEEKKKIYLKEIKADFNYFKTSYKRADIQIDIENIRINEIPELIMKKVREIIKFEKK